MPSEDSWPNSHYARWIHEKVRLGLVRAPALSIGLLVGHVVIGRRLGTKSTFQIQSARGCALLSKSPWLRCSLEELAQALTQSILDRPS